jgi:hypothetical protein
MALLSDGLVADLVPDARHARLLKGALVVGACYPFYLLTCYMAAKGFFAHEVFSSIWGLVVPVLFMALVFAPLLLILMFLGWGGPLVGLDRLLASARHAERPATPDHPVRSWLVEAGGLLVINAVVVGGLLYVLSGEDAAEARRPLLAVLFASLALGIVLVVGQRAAAAERRSLYAIVLAGALLLPLFGQDYTTGLVETILIQFRLGGVMVTTVPSEGPAPPLRGRLLFLSSSNLYLEVGCPRKLLIVPRRDSMHLEFAGTRTEGLADFRCEDRTSSRGGGRDALVPPGS